MTYNITLTANHQSLTAEYLPLAADTVQYLTAKVACETEDWTGREIKAMFGQGCTVYEVTVTGGEITAKQQLNLSAGDWRVWLVGNSARDGEVIPRITTNVAHISVAPTGGTEGNPFPATPPTVEEQLRADMGNLDDLTTKDKSNLVNAINEAVGGGAQNAVQYTEQTLTDEQQEQARANINAEKAGTGYTKPADGIPKADLAAGVQTSLELADRALQNVPDTYRTAAAQDKLDEIKQPKSITDDGGYFGKNPTVEGALQQLGARPSSDPSLGITAATVGQTIRVKAVDDTGKPTEWEAVDQRYTLTVTVNTQDGVTVTGQTVTVRAGDADGAVFGTAAYNGQAVSFDVPDGFAYYVEVTDDLAAHFKPSTAKGVINGASASVTLLYNDFSTIKTAPDIKAALDADMDLTELVGQQITCQRSGVTLAWDVVDYNATDKVVTLLMHDVLPDNMQFEPSQALAYFPDGLAAGAYNFVSGNNTYYFTLTKAIPAGGQLRATETTFDTYASQTAVAVTENGTVSTTAIDGATSLGKSGEGVLNNIDRVKYGSNNFGESGLRQWLNSSAAAGETMPQITKFQRPYAPNRPGFMAGLDADFVASVADAAWPCSANTTYECPADMGGITAKGASYTVVNKFALASEKELFGSYDGVQAGDAVFDLYQDADNTDRIKYYNNTARTWWMRSPYRDLAYYARYVRTSGAGYHTIAGDSTGVAVACKIAKSS